METTHYMTRETSPFITRPVTPLAPPPPAQPNVVLAAPPTPWFQRPAPTLAIGIVLLALCGLFAYLWMTTPFFLARGIGYLCGAGGIMCTWGGIHGVREERHEREWRA